QRTAQSTATQSRPGNQGIRPVSPHVRLDGNIEHPDGSPHESCPTEPHDDQSDFPCARDVISTESKRANRHQEPRTGEDRRAATIDPPDSPVVVGRHDSTRYAKEEQDEKNLTFQHWKWSPP